MGCFLKWCCKVFLVHLSYYLKCADFNGRLCSFRDCSLNIRRGGLEEN